VSIVNSSIGAIQEKKLAVLYCPAYIKKTRTFFPGNRGSAGGIFRHQEITVQHGDNLKTICIVGRSGSGKTTLIEKLTAHFSLSGMRVGAIKSAGHIDFNDAKDSERYRKAGASISSVTDGSRYAVFFNSPGISDPAYIAEKYFSDCDVVIIEGYKNSQLDKVEVIGDGPEEPLYRSGISKIRFAVSDSGMDDITCFKRDDVASIAGAIEAVCDGSFRGLPGPF
jgi:molybdopterin-guanine dinucleotide biosynthesis protein MobB